MKNVMVRAWEIAKAAVVKFGGKAREYIAQALAMAWKEVKTADFDFINQGNRDRENFWFIVEADVTVCDVRGDGSIVQDLKPYQSMTHKETGVVYNQYRTRLYPSFDVQLSRNGYVKTFSLDRKGQLVWK